MNNTVLTTIAQHNLINNNDHIIIGVSGGADSIALLHFLCSIRNESIRNNNSDNNNLSLTAVHINHGMRGDESDEDTNFVINFCKSLNIDLKCFYFDIYKESKSLSLSIEETARIFRYDTFNKVLNDLNADKIAVAHNKNDNAETIIMRFYRGSGIKGLSGIPIKRDNIIRPLINCERSTIEQYCKDNNILYRDDSTNFLEIYTRNKVRITTIPYIQENFNPNIINTLNNMSHNFAEEESFLNNMAIQYLDKILVDSTNNNLNIVNNIISIDLNQLKNLDIVIQKRVLRIAISKLCLDKLKNISLEHINSIINLLSNSTGKKLNLPENLTVYLDYNLLYIYLEDYKLNNNLNNNYNYQLIPENQIFISEINKNILLTKKYIKKQNFSTKVYTIVLDYDKIENIMFLRPKIDGDKIFLNNMNKKIKKLFIDLKIPSIKRNNFPVLLDGPNIVAILGLFVSDNYKILDDTISKSSIYLYIWEEH